MQPTANSSTEGRGVSLNVWCVCVWEEGGGRERDSVFAGCDRPAYRVLRVGHGGSFTALSLPDLLFHGRYLKRRKRKRRTTVDTSAY